MNTFTTDERPAMTQPWTATGQPETKKSRTWWIVGGAIVAALALFVVFLAGLGWEEANDQMAAESDPSWVYKENGPEVCEKAVLPQLKSPGSAVFTWEDPREDTESIPERDRWLMEGYVDSQNGFGAVLRTNIVCGMTLNDDDTMSASATLRK